ncbi:MAG: rhodanese-like domain-containing protein [Saprospiraceae bacterium]|jgi:rhodanese-related sulfurtransferase|nr:rhodanese-like domain-containing protein [Saprospiraceae bacterium]MBP6398034.1 rhodanese-like domain-containing protein [Saprospiraceae bacterium]
MGVNTMKYTLLIILICNFLPKTIAQKSSAADKDFAETVNNYLSFSVPVVSVDDLHRMQPSSFLLLDTREKDEYQVSHIKGAVHIGFNHFDAAALASVPKDKKIIVYCSIGYRSEKIGERLISMGYRHVYNLYGSIFEWVNRGFEVVDTKGRPVKKIHGFDKNWSKWVLNPSYTKVY